MPNNKQKKTKKKVKAWAIVCNGKFSINQIFHTRKLARINTLKAVFGASDTKEEIIPVTITYEY